MIEKTPGKSEQCLCSDTHESECVTVKFNINQVDETQETVRPPFTHSSTNTQNPLHTRARRRHFQLSILVCMQALMAAVRGLSEYEKTKPLEEKKDDDRPKSKITVSLS